MGFPRSIASLLAVINLLAVGGCTAEEIKWTEEVQLHDGRIIQLKRKTEIGASGFPVQRRGFDHFYEFCYAPMGMHWKMRRGYQPDIFEIVEGKAYLHVPVTGCIQCKLQDYPASNALAFVWEHRAWKRIPYEEFPASLRWNLLRGSEGAQSKDDARGLITLAQKQSRDYGLIQNQRYKGWMRISQAKDYVEQCGTCSRNIQISDTPDVFLATKGTTCDW